MEELWERVAQGRHTALLGIVPGEPPASLGVRVVRVRCDVPRSTLGPLLEARRKIDALLGGGLPLLDEARTRVVTGLRRRLLGDVADAGGDGVFLEAVNRLAQGDLRCALVFDAIEGADEATLDALRRIVLRPESLRVPLVLSFRTPDPLGGAGALLAALRATAGPDAVLRTPRTKEGEALAAEVAQSLPPGGFRALPADVLRVLRAGAVVGSGFEAELVAALLDMDEIEVLEALQRAADAGVPLDDRGEGRFHLPEALVEEVCGSLLPSLARAWHRRLAGLLSEEDEGARARAPSDGRGAPIAGPVIDLGAAVAGLSESAASAASAVFPGVPESAVEESLRLRRAPSVAPPAGPDIPEAAVPPPPAAPAPDVAAPPPAEPPALEVVQVPPMPAWPYAEIYAKASAGGREEATPAPVWEGPASAPEVSASAPPEPATPAAPAPISPAAASPAEPAPAPVSPAAPPGVVVDSFGAGDAPAAAAEEAAAFARRRGGAPRGQAARMDDARAAGHLSAAGELEAAAKRYCAAAAQAVAVGVYPQALGYAEQALSLLERLPATPERRRLRIRALMETARVHWLAGAPSPSVEGAAFTLPRALELLEQARARTAPEDPAELHAELSTLIADVCYDLGDLRSLERALDELTFASRRLLDAGDATGAARLLNDQAALYVRMGDPVRAAHLLGESRKVFEERADRDPVALLEMAETDHLFARIPLHVPARPGREGDALSMGLDHAIAAERTYKRVGAARELARVWETMGRLELRKGRFDRATARLSAALELQHRIGDLVGLARSTAAFSEVLGAVGRHREALMVLSDSVALNLEKGSPIGLAFNRRAFDALAARVSPRSESADVLAKVAAQLDQAEATLGRMKLTSELS